ncbi:MAG: hypothetical protein HY538_02490 [Deltaproteobacteria bacterium]|nr:hypothetical protein [Deltaproteobacteria bacterium]
MGLSSLASLWNEICKSLSPVRYVSSNRQRKEQLRLRERDEKGWREVFQKIETSSFCRGENERGWRASYDWIIANPDNALKVLERKYDDHDSRNSRREKLLEELRNIP